MQELKIAIEVFHMVFGVKYQDHFFTFKILNSSLHPTVQDPSPNAPLSLSVDASNLTVEAVLKQHAAGSWRQLAFFSKKLHPAETIYSAFDH